MINKAIHRNYGDSGDPDRWKVDEVIECLDITDELRKRLMQVAPSAYQGRGIYVSAIWNRLTAGERAQLKAAYEKEYK